MASNQSTITTTIQNTGSVSVPQSGQSFVEANGTSPGIFTIVTITNTPTALTIPTGTTQVIINAVGATTTGTATVIGIGGAGVAFANMLLCPVTAAVASPVTAALVIKVPVKASSPALLLACDSGATIVGVNVMFE